MEKELSIVIPCKNERENIGRLLEELSLQRVGSTRIILADANSSDGTVEEAKTVALSLGLNLYVTVGGLPAKGRNMGAFMVSTKYVLFVDADVTFTTRFSLLECLERMESGEYDMLSTTPIYRGDGNWRASLIFFINKITTILMSKKDPFAIGAFTMVRLDKFVKLGGYDEEVKHTEDWLLSKKIEPRKFLLIPDLITQNDRRFLKTGYFGMIKLVFINWINRNNRDHYLKDVGYF